MKKIHPSILLNTTFFSEDGRYVYFSASGDYYGKNCDDIYRLDLKYQDQINNPARISRVSSGIGHSTSVSIAYQYDRINRFTYESTFEKVKLI